VDFWGNIDQPVIGKIAGAFGPCDGARWDMVRLHVRRYDTWSAMRNYASFERYNICTRKEEWRPGGVVEKGGEGGARRLCNHELIIIRARAW